MIEAVKGAARDAGSEELLKANSVRVSKGIWPYQNPGKAITAEAIGCPHAESVISSFGGNFVQTRNSSERLIFKTVYTTSLSLPALSAVTPLRRLRRQS